MVSPLAILLPIIGALLLAVLISEHHEERAKVRANTWTEADTRAVELHLRALTQDEQ